MIAALARRALAMLAVVAVTVSVAFALVVALPADPARALVGPRASPETLARVRAHYCLDRGLLGRYGCFVGRLARGDLGESLRSRRPVATLIGERAVASAQLAGAALALQLATALPLAAWAARRRTWLVELGLTVGHSVPAFVLGPLLIYLVGFELGWLPLGGHGGGGLDRVRHLALPAITLALATLPASVRLLRDQLTAQLAADHVRAARARGVSARAVVWRHALRPALRPWLAFQGVELGALVGGAIVVEAAFAWPGLGRETMLAVRDLDLPVLLGVTLVSALAVTSANALADALAWWLDPRADDREASAR